MTLTLTWYWWFTPLLITFLAAIPAGTYRQRGDYDFTGAFLGMLWLAVSGTAWVVSIIMRLSV